ncbi:MAG: thiamine phosphate synthase [Flavobacteriales bacterium]|nr:thiamine phosphate synthase [Flavobacteriales bacterium]
MKLIILSRRKIHKREPETVTSLFKNGLETFHLRKPGASKADIEDFLKQIPQKYLNRVVLHSKHELVPKYGLKGIHLTSRDRKKKFRTWFHMKYLKVKHPLMTMSTSFHSLETLIEGGSKYDYSFLSPVFDSVSKANHKGQFAKHNLSVIFDKLEHKTIALGGVEEDKIEKVREMGFTGAAVLGAIWKSPDPLAKFIRIKNLCLQQSTVSA